MKPPRQWKRPALVLSVIKVTARFGQCESLIHAEREVEAEAALSDPGVTFSALASYFYWTQFRDGVRTPRIIPTMREILADSDDFLVEPPVSPDCAIRKHDNEHIQEYRVGPHDGDDIVIRLRLEAPPSAEPSERRREAHDDMVRALREVGTERYIPGCVRQHGGLKQLAKDVGMRCRPSRSDLTPDDGTFKRALKQVRTEHSLSQGGHRAI